MLSCCLSWHFEPCLRAELMHGPQAIDRRERLRRLALETIDLSKDPYFMRNHLGQVRLLTLLPTLRAWCTVYCIAA